MSAVYTSGCVSVSAAAAEKKKYKVFEALKYLRARAKEFAHGLSLSSSRQRSANQSPGSH